MNVNKTIKPFTMFHVLLCRSQRVVVRGRTVRLLASNAIMRWSKTPIHSNDEVPPITNSNQWHITTAHTMPLLAPPPPPHPSVLRPSVCCVHNEKYLSRHLKVLTCLIII